MTRREMLEKRHKRVRGSVSLITNCNLAAFSSGSESSNTELNDVLFLHNL
jgi:hypothetical protein